MRCEDMRLPAGDRLRDRLISVTAKGRQDFDRSTLVLGVEENAGMSPPAWGRK